MNRRKLLLAAVGLPLLLQPAMVSAGRAPVYAESGIAILGADPVAYFRGEGPVAGTVNERVMWRGAVWLFANRQNREAFERDPRHFAPRFGGYCAYTLSQGALAPTDPRAYKIHRGRLYLMTSLHARETWKKNLELNIKRAEKYWPIALGLACPSQISARGCNPDVMVLSCIPRDGGSEHRRPFHCPSFRDWRPTIPMSGAFFIRR
jgi:hypothetical protein